MSVSMDNMSVSMDIMSVSMDNMSVSMDTTLYCCTSVVTSITKYSMGYAISQLGNIFFNIPQVHVSYRQSP